MRFKFRMLYHQSRQEKNGERVSVLKKVEDKYNWTDIEFPVSFTEVQNFEDQNEICVNLWGISYNNEVHPLRLGTIPYVKNDTVKLLLLHDGDKGHYVYIKKRAPAALHN